MKVIAQIKRLFFVIIILAAIIVFVWSRFISSKPNNNSASFSRQPYIQDFNNVIETTMDEPDNFVDMQESETRNEEDHDFPVIITEDSSTLNPITKAKDDNDTAVKSNNLHDQYKDQDHIAGENTLLLKRAEFDRKVIKELQKPAVGDEVNKNQSKMSLSISDEIYQRIDVDKKKVIDNKSADISANNDKTRFETALFYQKNGELTLALHEYKKIIKNNPLNAEVYNNIGSVYQEINEYDKAIKEFRKALSINPAYDKARNNLGVALLKKGYIDSALQQFKVVLKSNPNNIHGHVNSGIAYKMMNDMESAKTAFVKAISIDPTCAEAYYNLALIFEEDGLLQEACLNFKYFLQYSDGTYQELAKMVLQHIKEIENVN